MLKTIMATLFCLLVLSPIANAELSVIRFEKAKNVVKQGARLSALAAVCQPTKEGPFKVHLLEWLQAQGADEFQLSLLSSSYDSAALEIELQYYRPPNRPCPAIQSVKAQQIFDRLNQILDNKTEIPQW